MLPICLFPVFLPQDPEALEEQIVIADDVLSAAAHDRLREAAATRQKWASLPELNAKVQR